MRKMYITENIRVLRRSHKWKQSELAAKVGVETCTVHAWEREGREPRLYYAAMLADLFGITVDELCFSKFE